MKLKRILTLASAAFLSVALVTACGSKAKRSTSSDAAAAISSAETTMKKAGALSWIWRDTAKDLKKAKAAQKKGDNAGAVKFANKAKRQADMAIKQYHYEKSLNRSVKSKRRRRS
ncbi:hypothetical protein MNBD_GAMMA12-3647 [hydrothermal vent metagenome]|uniref:SoxXA-binding protein n=1 Tax=hydrothermal vent metagenome TaxID=652676 RepID=A0A3B0YMK3_9ZZZZ